MKRLSSVAALLLAGCARDATPIDPDTTDVNVVVRNGAIEAPDTIPAGWRRIRVDEDGSGHIVVIFRLEHAQSESDIAEFIEALDTAAATPAMAVAMGGPEVGDSGEVIVQLKPGMHVLGCVRRGSDKHRHAISGEAKTIVVGSAGADSTYAAPPRATAELRMVDFAYVGPDKWQGGRQILRLVNDGQQDHQLRLVRLRAGSSVSDWMNSEDPDDHGTAVVGVARMGSGQVAYLPVELAAGSYVAYCLISHPVTKTPHVEMGMIRSIQVATR